MDEEVSILDDDNPLNAALRQFEATEANLVKLEKLWGELRKLIPDGIAFGGDAKYEDACRSFEILLGSLPAIDGWKASATPMDLNAIAQNRLDWMEIGEPTAEFHFEEAIDEPERELREYRFRFGRKRRELIRDSLLSLVDATDVKLRELRKKLSKNPKINEKMNEKSWALLVSLVDQIGFLLGSAPRPSRWTDLGRHLHFGYVGDF